MSFKWSVLVTFAVQLGILLVDKASGFVVLKLFENNKAEKGLLDQLMILPSVLMAVANLGFGTSVVYYLRKGEFSVRAAGETGSFMALVWGSWLGAGAVLFTVWLGATPEYPAPPLMLLVPMGVLVPFMLTTSYMNSIQLAVGRIRHYNLVHIAQSLPFLPIFLILWLCGVPLLQAGVSAKFSVLVATCFFTVWLVRDVAPWLPRFHSKVFAKGISYGWRANLNSTITLLNHRLDIYLVGLLFVTAAAVSAEDAHRLSLEEVAYYSLAVSLAELIWYLPEAMRDLFFSRVAGQSDDDARRFTPVVCRNMLLICLVGALAIWFLIDPLLALMGSKLRHGWGPVVVPALHWLLPGNLLFVISKVLQTDLVARGRINHTVVASAVCLVTMVVCDFAMIPGHGAVGAAAASTCGYVAGTLYTLVLYVRTSGTRWYSCLFPHREDMEHWRRGAREVLRRVTRGPEAKGAGT